MAISHNAVIGNTRSTVVNILDDEAALPQIFIYASSAGPLYETSGLAHLTVQLDRVPSTNVFVNLNTYSGTATEGADFQGKHIPVGFSAGMNPPSLGVDIPILTDTIQEDVETFQVVLSNPVNGVFSNSPFFAGPVAIVSITDVLSPLSVQFSATNYTVGEGDVFAALSVTLNHAPDAIVMVNYTTSDFTATSGTNDYVPVSGTLTRRPTTISKWPSSRASMAVACSSVTTMPSCTPSVQPQPMVATLAGQR